MSTQETDQGDATSVPEGAPACGSYACCVPADVGLSNPTCPTEEGCGEGEPNGCTGTPTSGGDPLQRMLTGMVAEMLGNIGNRYQEDCDGTDDTDDTGSESSDSTDVGDIEHVEIYDDAQLHLLLQAHLELVRAVCSRRR